MTIEDKKHFTEPACEILKFSVEDIITTSDGSESLIDDWTVPEL